MLLDTFESNSFRKLVISLFSQEWSTTCHHPDIRSYSGALHKKTTICNCTNVAERRLCSDWVMSFCWDHQESTSSYSRIPAIRIPPSYLPASSLSELGKTTQDMNFKLVLPCCTQWQIYILFGLNGDCRWVWRQTEETFIARTAAKHDR